MTDEMTNQTSTEATTDDDFGAFLAEGSDDTTEETSTQEEPTTADESKQQTSTEQTAPFMDIKYNGAVEHLSKDQAVELAQKGRNYDKINQRLQDLQNSPVMKTITEQANRAGLSLEDYANRLQEFQKTSDINQIADDFKAQHPDVSDDAAQDYAKKAYEAQSAEEERAQQQQAAQQEQDIQAQAEAQVQAFRKEYPNVDVSKLPQEVIDDINHGETLLNAYRAFDLKQLRATLQAERKNTENRGRSVGNLTDNSGGAGEDDPFLQGLLGK